MNFTKIALFLVLSLSLAFSQNSTPQQTAMMPGFEISEEDMALIKLLLNNEMFKNSFTEQCTAESAALLGAEQAAKSCSCAYEGLIKNDKLLVALATTDNDDGFNKWGYDVIEPCLPEQFTAAMGDAFVKQCVAESGESARGVCKCTYDSIVKKYNVKSLLKAAFENPEKIQVELITMAGQCALR